MFAKTDYDAIIVGAGPNGLSAAIALQQAGLSVLIIEAKETVGGGMRSAELTLPGFMHDICSAVHPLAAGSPFFQTLPLSKYGLKFIYPEIQAAHPFDNGQAVALYKSVEETARLLGADEQNYLNLIGSLVDAWPEIYEDVLAPLKFPSSPLLMAQFGLKAMRSALSLSETFSTQQARGLWAGMAAHSIQPLSHLATSAIAMVLMAVGHTQGWPVAEGGSKQIANSLATYFQSLGGTVQTGLYVKSLAQLPSAKAVLFDITPRQLLEIAGQQFSALYRWQLKRYRYGMGVFKMDWALSEQIPFKAGPCRKAGTVHLGNTIEEIAASESAIWKGEHAEKPYVLLAQQSVIDPSRAPAGKHTAWAYCHVPNGSTRDMTNAIEKQVERFAPGFRDTILATRTMNCMEMETYNPNYIGGDINGGAFDLGQLFTRPVLRFSPYRTSAKGLYICSSSTPPGGGVHGMCGYHAAQRVLRDLFPQHHSNK